MTEPKSNETKPDDKTAQATNPAAPAAAAKAKKRTATYTDDRAKVEFRGYTFKKGEPVEVDDKTFAKLENHPCFKVSGG